MAKTYTGIDIGSNMLKMAVCDGANVRKLVAEQLPENLVRDGKIVSEEAMSSFIRETAKKSGVHIKKCAFLLPPSDGTSFTRRFTMPLMTAEQLKLNLPYEFRDYITQEKESYIYDYAVLGRSKSAEDDAAEELDILGAAALSESVENYRYILKRAGFSMAVAMPLEFAYANLLHSHIAHAGESAADKVYCIIDIGHSSTRVLIYSGSKLEVTRLIEYGVGMLDRAIADSLGVDEYVARSYKHLNHQNVLALEGCTSVYENIAIEIIRAISYFGFNSGSAVLETAYVGGGGAMIKPLIAAINDAAKLNMQTENLSIQSITEIMPAFRAENEQQQALAPFCAAAVGVTLQ